MLGMLSADTSRDNGLVVLDAGSKRMTAKAADTKVCSGSFVPARSGPMWRPVSRSTSRGIRDPGIGALLVERSKALFQCGRFAALSSVRNAGNMATCA